MAVAIRMPDLGTTVDEVRIVKWLVSVGDRVKRGDLLVEVETDKASSELESVAEGVLLRQMVPPGATAGKGDVIAYVGKPGESIPVETAEAPAVSGEAGKPLRVSPVVENLAKKLGVRLSQIEGTGHGGMVTREDVLRASKAQAREAPAAGEGLPRSQAAVARAVLRSSREIPHLRVTASIDMTASQELRSRAQTSGTKISYDAIFLKAMAGAIQAVPLVAARLDGERVVRPKGIHIAVAIGLENELFLPVIRDVDRKDLLILQQEISALSSRAKTGGLKADEMTGGCMALSNLGMYPIESFDAIIFPEHSAVVALGAVQSKPVVVGERLEVRPVAIVTLAADHRLINGRTAAQFLSKVKEIVESGTFD